MILPIYLDTTLQKKLEPLARSQGKGIGEVVNDILKNQVQLLTTLNPTKRPNRKRILAARSVKRTKIRKASRHGKIRGKPMNPPPLSALTRLQRFPRRAKNARLSKRNEAPNTGLAHS